MTIGMYAITTVRSKYMDSIKSHLSFPFILLVPPGAKLSPFQKFLRPFQLEIWLALSLTFICGFWFVIIVSIMGSNKFKNSVFGERINPPYLNMIDICFGGSLHKLPKKNFPRVMLAAFLIFCLVMRSLYQGLMFQFLQSDDRASPVMTVDEMIEKDFHFYMYSIYQEHTENLKIHPRLKLFELQHNLAISFKYFQTESLRIL